MPRGQLWLIGSIQQSLADLLADSQIEWLGFSSPIKNNNLRHNRGKIMVWKSS